MNMSISRPIAAFCILASGMFAAQSAQAFEISVSPSATNVLVGDSFQVDIVASGLGNGVAPSIGGFNVSTGYDSALLTLDSVTFGTGLDLGLWGSFQNVTHGAASVEVDEVSFEDIFDLDSLQPESFTLFTLDFTADVVGSTMLDLSALSFSDSTGLITLSPVLNAANTITISSTQGGGGNTGGSVPEPSVLALAGLGLLGMHIARRRRR